MQLKKRFLLLVTALLILKATGLLAQVAITPETFANIQPDRQGQCRMTTNVTTPCERYLYEGKYYLVLYALVGQEVTVVKIVLLAPDGTLKSQKTEWIHPILAI